MNILIHSVYSNKDVFLRELVSNASDALNKLRVLMKMGAAEGHSEPEIVITIDRRRSVLTVEDNGIGMTRAELIANLGTVASSGTLAFLERTQEVGRSQDRVTKERTPLPVYVGTLVLARPDL
jgi:molecular chaperone HtpG